MFFIWICSKSSSTLTQSWSFNDFLKILRGNLGFIEWLRIGLLSMYLFSLIWISKGFVTSKLIPPLTSTVLPLWINFWLIEKLIGSLQLKPYWMRRMSGSAIEYRTSISPSNCPLIWIPLSLTPHDWHFGEWLISSIIALQCGQKLYQWDSLTCHFYLIIYTV